MIIAELTQRQSHVVELLVRWIVVHEGEPATEDVFVLFVDVLWPPLLLDMQRQTMPLLSVLQ